MPSLFPQLFAFEQLAPLVLRLALGAVFITRGWPKLFRHFQGTAEFFETMDIRPARTWVLVLGVAELFGGILLVFGFLTQLAALILSVDILGRLWKVSLWRGFIDGYEFELSLLAISLSLLVFGPGAFSLDLPL